jgi:mannose-6-phosphate isomerase-like protein (cupin superfamily)
MLHLRSIESVWPSLFSNREPLLSLRVGELDFLEKQMPKLIEKPTRITAAGNKPKLIDEYIGRVNTGESSVSIAHMRSPGGWVEPGQRPEFDEYTLVLRGMLRVEHRGGALDVHAGQGVLVQRGEWVRYSTPGEEGAEYVAVCLPAFSPETVHREGA